VGVWLERKVFRYIERIVAKIEAVIVTRNTANPYNGPGAFVPECRDSS